MRRSGFALLLFLVAACSKPAPLEVKDVWARDTIGGTTNAAIFMTIASPTPDRLLGASTPVAKKTDLMTMTGGSSATEMKYLQDIAIPAGKPVSLNASGLHVWLADLNQPLKAGQSFKLLLRFEEAGARTVTVSVVKPTESPPMSGMQM